MAAKIEILRAALEAALGDRLRKAVVDRGQLTIEVGHADLIDVATALRDDKTLAFSQLLDLIGVDYEGYGGGWDGPRYAVVYNLLSIEHNWRVRMRVFSGDDDFPAVESVIGVWPSANWDERAAFDLYGIGFRGPPDLRRIPTDYSIRGHPCPADFPVYP